MVKTIFLLLFSFSVFAANNPIVISGQSNKVYDGSDSALVGVDGKISNTAGTCISVVNSTNIVLRNFHVEDCLNQGISITGSTSVMILSASLYNTGGITAATSQGIHIEGNTTIKKVVGTARHCVSFDTVNSVVEGSTIIGLKCLSEIGDGNTRTDGINIKNSSGTLAAPIMISNNVITGYGSPAGGNGITIGDTGGNNIYIVKNVLYMPGDIGILIKGGNNNIIESNLIINPQSTRGSYGIRAAGTVACDHIGLFNNKVRFKTPAGVVSDISTDTATCFEASDGSVNVNNLSQGSNL